MKSIRPSQCVSDKFLRHSAGCSAPSRLLIAHVICIMRRIIIAHCLNGVHCAMIHGPSAQASTEPANTRRVRQPLCKDHAPDPPPSFGPSAGTTPSWNHRHGSRKAPAAVLQHQPNQHRCNRLTLRCLAKGSSSTGWSGFTKPRLKGTAWARQCTSTFQA